MNALNEDHGKAFQKLKTATSFMDQSFEEMKLAFQSIVNNNVKFGEENAIIKNIRRLAHETKAK